MNQPHDLKSQMELILLLLVVSRIPLEPTHAKVFLEMLIAREEPYHVEVTFDVEVGSDVEVWHQPVDTLLPAALQVVFKPFNGFFFVRTCCEVTELYLDFVYYHKEVF